MRALFASLLLILPVFGQAQVVSALSDAEIDITTTFSGAELFVYGAVKGLESEQPFDVVIVVEGPGTPLLVRRKGRNFGIWINEAAAELQNAPSFYAIASTAPLDGILKPITDDFYNIRFDQIFAHGAVTGDDPEAFAEAVIRLKQNDALYTLQEGGVELIDNTLFSAKIDMPSKVIEGPYTVRFHLIRDQEVFAYSIEDIRLRKIGFERWIYDLAYERPYFYGFLALFIAIAAGWGASQIFTRLFHR